MKRILLATILASGALAMAPTFANDVSSVIPAAPIGSATAPVTTIATIYPFGNADVVSVIPAAPAGAAVVRESVAASKPAPFGNPDVTCTM